MILTSMLIALVCIFIYKRYFPVNGVTAVKKIKPNEDSVLLDLRDYQTTSKDPIPGAINIPYAYLKRYVSEIPNQELLIIATDSIEKNLAIRFLSKKRFAVKGFIILNEKRSDDLWNLTS